MPVRVAKLFSVVCMLALFPSALSTWLAPDLLVSICRIQGYYFTSLYQGQAVTTTGIVTLDLDSTSKRGFYIQHDGCDTNASSSNGLFVYINERLDVVAAGDSVQVSGTVEEYYGRTELNSTAAQVQVISHANPIPAAVELDPPFDGSEARVYLERLEGMHVRLSAGRVVGPTGADARTWLIRAGLGLERVFDDEAAAGAVLCADDGGLYMITPPAAVGDRLDGLDGALDYRLGVYCLELGAPPALSAAALPPLPAYSPHPGLTIATFNLSNLFDASDDPAVDDELLSAPEYQRRLYKHAMTIRAALSEPAVLAVQEVENAAILHDLVADPDVIRASYQALVVDSPDSRGLDVGLMVRPDQAWPLEYAAWQGCTALVDGLGPDGNGDLSNPANTPTCDLNGDGVLDGNRLFSRPPLAVRLRLEQAHPPGQPRKEIWVIVAHLKSKVEDTATQPFTQPRRIEQARFIADLAGQLGSQHPGLEQFVLGDLNDAPTSPALQALLEDGFQDISAQISRPSRYTYNYQGISQSLDYILWRPLGVLGLQSIAAMHINADFPPAWADDLSHYRRSSDHDPLLARFILPDYWLRLPLLLVGDS